jgi:Ca-activated chloride channel family protein
MKTNLPTSAFGLVAWLEKTRVALPLKGVECRFHVTGAIAGVEVDQIYHQNADRPLDCTYTFPLPSGAAVYRCELHVNGRVIRAVVEEKEKAQQIFREQKAAGRRAALVESERENLFTLSLGNVQPDDLIVVRFAWFQVLDRSGEGLRLMVPTCPGVRYIPGKPLLRELSGRGTADDTDQVPDASRITPPRIDSLHPDAAYFSMEGRLSSADVEPGTLTSPSHPVCVREAEGQMSVALFGHSAVPDRDFVLVWHPPKAKQLVPQAWRWTEAGETYALVQLRAPEAVNVAEGFSQDFYFLVDRSGSMEGAKWQRTCEALRAFVALLGPQDRVAITLFESDFRDFAEAPLPAPRVLVDAGFRRMVSLGAAGGTELLPAVHHMLELVGAHSQGRRITVVLITDGQIGNESAVISAFKGTPSLTVHTFGIDTAVNDALRVAFENGLHNGEPKHDHSLRRASACGFVEQHLVANSDRTDRARGGADMAASLATLQRQSNHPI